MPIKPIPDGYHSVTPYLIVPGVRGLLDFVVDVFDAVLIEAPMTRPDGSVMHAEVRIGDSILMMGEPSGDFAAMPASLYLYVGDADAVYRKALKAGGVSLMEPADQFYGDRSAGVKDPAGNCWWIATHREDLSPQEIASRAKALASRGKLD
ncbi:MAG: VOC family protein [Acidobacteria bacterium]|nr:VOC family protein [Acidobacteriota bacterium]